MFQLLFKQKTCARVIPLEKFYLVILKSYTSIFFSPTDITMEVCAPQMAVSAMHSFTPSTPKGSVPQNLFKGMKDISRATATPRKLNLMYMICRKEDHVRKLKKICKKI
jgi:hypothetical protein